MDLLAVAREHEQRIVDRHADPDHRGDVRDEDRHLGGLRQSPDRRARERHAPEAERERQGGRGERAEDGEQDDEHDREAGLLGRCEVPLAEVLHAGPQRLLADEVERDAVPRAVLDVEMTAQSRHCVGRLVLAAGQPHRDEGHPAVADAAKRRQRGRPRQPDSRLTPGRAAQPADGCSHRAVVRARACLDDRCELLPLRAGEGPKRGVGALRARSGNDEPAARQVVGLPQRERYGRDDRREPHRDDDRTAALHERGKHVHRALHLSFRTGRAASRPPHGYATGWLASPV